MGSLRAQMLQKIDSQMPAGCCNANVTIPRNMLPSSSTDPEELACTWDELPGFLTKWLSPVVVVMKINNFSIDSGDVVMNVKRQS